MRGRTMRVRIMRVRIIRVGTIRARTAIGAAVAMLCAAMGAGCADELTPADRSLSVAQYREMGLPPLTRRWSPQECSKVRELLRQIAERDLTLLPRHASADSGAVFRKLVSEQLTGGASPTSFVSQLAEPQLEELGSEEVAARLAEDSLLGVYLSLEGEGPIFDRELVEYNGQQVVKLLETLETLAGFMPTTGGSRAEVPVGGLLGNFGESLAKAKRLSQLLLFRHVARLAGYGSDERLRSVARVEAVSYLAANLGRTLPLLEEDGRSALRELLREAARSPGAAPGLAKLAEDA